MTHSANRRPLLIYLVTIVCIAGLHTTGWSQTDERPWRETLQVDTTLLAAKRLENVRGLIEQQQWEAALAALEVLEQEFPDALVGLEQGRYVQIPLAVRLLISHLPAEGLAVYRQRLDGWAEQQLARSANGNDVAALHQLLTSAFPSSAGDDALNQLAERAWEQGDIDAARRFWTQIIPLELRTDAPLVLRYPQSDFNMADIYARLILCSLAEGDKSRARGEVDAFETLFPEAAGALAGHDGPFMDTLELLLQDEWPSPTASADCPTFAKQPTRNAASSRQVELNDPLWTLSLPPAYVPRWEHPREALPERGLLARFPVTSGDGLFLHDGTTIHGLKLEDGSALWPVDLDTRSDETPGKIYPPFPAIPNSLPWIPVVGLPRYTSTIANGKLYALLGPAVLTLPPRGQPASPTRLVCINIARGEGRLEWFHAADDLFPPGWLITGTPVADGAHLYVPLVRSDTPLELAVACLRASDGNVIWQQTIGQPLRKALEGRVELGHQLLTLAEGRLFLSTDFGGVAALDAQSGRVEWIVTYPTTPRDAIDRSDEQSFGLMPPVYHEGIVFVKPNDSDDLLAIESQTGAVFWRKPTPGPIVHLLGVADSTLFASGHHLWAIDLFTGQPRWRFGYDDAAGYGYGRGVISGDQIYWTTRESLFVVDSHDGNLRQRLPLEESLGVTGGHLLIAGDRLLIAGPNHLTAFDLRNFALEPAQSSVGGISR